ncbi:hypothetical protein GCM10020220_112750 [Nonomuraea rubra]|uniref:hypothetical protein n=1 Tax=Nonomuraea rubra TaxID=46180 RepID=UPI0031EDC13B
MPKLGKDPLKAGRSWSPASRTGTAATRRSASRRPTSARPPPTGTVYWPTNTGKSRIRYRGFVAENGKTYAIYWHTLSSHWKQDYDFFEGFCATFVPLK